MSSTATDTTPVRRLLAAPAAALPGDRRWQDWRGAARARLATLGLPTPRDENWKYTHLRLLERRDLTPAGTTQIDRSVLEGLSLPGVGHRLVFVDGRHVPELSDRDLPAGCSVRPLTEAATPADLTTPTDSADDRVLLLNAAFVGAGVVIEVAPGRELATPIHCLLLATRGSSFPRLRLELGAGARATIVEHHTTLPDQETLAAAVTEVRLAEGAHLEHCRVQLNGARAVHLDEVRVEVGRDARYVQHQVALGAQLARTGARVRLTGRGGSTALDGLFMVDGSRHLETALVVDHLASRTGSDQVYRGIAGGRGRGVFNGKVVMHAGHAQMASAQSSRNLLLSPQAEIDARPQLEIHADDVKSSHGATTGSLDPNMLFYLLSRGLEPATARGLLTFAFAADVVSRLPLAGLRRFLEERIVGQLPDADLIREFL